MITSELVSYIKKQIQNNIPKDLIISKLLNAGWHAIDIDEAFFSIDKYKEPLIDEDFLVLENKKVEEIKKEEPIAEIKKEESKIWVPMSIPIKEIQSKHIDHAPDLDVKNYNLKKEELSIEVQNIELPKIESIPKINTQIESTKIDNSINLEEKPKGSINDINLPKIAMISSYKTDMMSIQKEEESALPKKIKTIKWFILLLVTILAGLFYWAFTMGYLNINNLNIFSIKKDPKILLLNNSKILSSLKSYKTETNLEISSPSFANISSALITGETISSNDKDSISINTLGIINQNNEIPVFDNFITIKSSLLDNYITTDIKNDGSSLFISTPDLTQFMGENSPESSIVKINESQFEMIPSLFPKEIELNLKKFNIYNIISKGMSSYINTDTLSAYDDLINNVEIVEKGTENIKGIDTYHYSINADRQLAKKLFVKISNNFISNISEQDKSNLDQLLGSVDIDSFDIWIGKGDNNIYQYSFILGVPLSKVIGFEDKSIGDNQVKISWKATYYDFDVTNNLFMPEKSIPAIDYINSIKEAEIKNDIFSFYKLSNNLFELEKNYGTKSNTKGDCMAPVSGSLFSPTGHSKGATTIISSISSLLNKVFETTNGVGFCYSSSKDWSFTVPISSNYDPLLMPEGGYKSFYCIDSNGGKENLTAFPTGNVCLPKVESVKVAN